MIARRKTPPLSSFRAAPFKVEALSSVLKPFIAEISFVRRRANDHNRVQFSEFNFAEARDNREGKNNEQRGGNFGRKLNFGKKIRRFGNSGGNYSDVLWKIVYFSGSNLFCNVKRNVVC